MNTVIPTNGMYETGGGRHRAGNDEVYDTNNKRGFPDILLLLLPYITTHVHPKQAPLSIVGYKLLFWPTSTITPLEGLGCTVSYFYHSISSSAAADCSCAFTIQQATRR